MSPTKNYKSIKTYFDECMDYYNSKYYNPKVYKIRHYMKEIEETYPEEIYADSIFNAIKLVSYHSHDDDRFYENLFLSDDRYLYENDYKNIDFKYFNLINKSIENFMNNNIFWIEEI